VLAVVDSVRGASLPGGFLPSASPRPIDASVAVVVFLGAWVAAQLVASIVLAVVHGTGTGTDPTFAAMAVALAGAWSTYLAAMWMASQRAGSGDVVADYGIRFRPIDVVGLGIGAVCSLVLIRVVYLPLEAIWPATFNEERLTENAEDLVARADGSTWLVVLVVVVGAPLVEELFYRGLLQRSLAARYHEAAVVVAVAAVFAVVHFRAVEIPGLFAIGLVFGWAALRTDRLGMAIAIHAGFNAVGIAQAL
jgi:membrane protease YdiL (CAAX protease family)